MEHKAIIQSDASSVGSSDCGLFACEAV